jgi:predicted SnoaL-like aldol condensation-catalyzing enzyme
MMTLTSGSVAPVEIVTAFFALLRSGKIEQASQYWSPDATWHITGQSSRAGDYLLPAYLELCKQWYVEYPAYSAELSALTAIGELVYFVIKSRNGEAPDETEGMMLYRVVDGLITEGWAIPARHGDRYTF